MKMKNVEDIYPLSPMQQGMLFHTLYDPTSGVYFEQLSCTLTGEFNIPAFKQAWEEVMKRHAVLRTAFLWEGLDKPLQVVRQKVTLPWEAHDWRGLPNQEERLEAFLEQDRQRGFELAKAPLMRCILIRLDRDKYEFVWGFHHVLMDGWSFPLIMKEVFAFYDAFSKGQSLSLTRPRPYRNYIAWLQMQDMSQAEAYWRQALKGFTAPTPLVVTKEGAKASDIYEDVYVHLSQGVTKKLQSLAKQHHLTLNTLIQGAWALLLSRYSGEQDVLFGATVSGRPTELVGAESMVGLFINTLPMRVAVSDEMDLMPWLQQMQAQAVEQRQYEYTPLVEIQAWSEVPRGSALFDSILVFENYPVDESLQEEPAGSLEVAAVRSFERTNYPLTVVALPGREFSLRMSYDSGYFEADTMVRMAGHLQTLLEGIAANPQQQVKALPLLTAAEREQLLVEWNQSEVAYPDDKCFHQWFEEQVAQTPNALALLFGDQELTYRELNALANRLARHLQKLGVGADQLVGLCVERSLEMVVGLLGIWKAGGAYVPLDPTYPKERLAFMLSDCGAKVVLTQERLLDQVNQLRNDALSDEAHIISLDQGGDKAWQALARGISSQRAAQNRMSGVTPDNLAYCIYTSGSTGKPKGVLIGHQGVCNLAQAQIRAFDVRPNSRVLQFASLSFDASLSEIVMTLGAGATLVLAEQDDLLPGTELMDLLREQAITHVTLPPSALAVMDAEALPALRTLVVAGEACPKEIVAEWSPGRRFFNAYGPTESTVCATIAECRDGTRKPLIGRPIDNTQIYILDRNLQPVPVGVPGELHIGSVGLAKGYLNRPVLSKEKFIANPFAPGKLYKTGDLARYITSAQALSEGKDVGNPSAGSGHRIDFLGRIDHQVKLRGYRIELGEIEAVLNEHAQVRETVAIVREDQPGDQRLVAYFVAKGQPAPTSSDLRRYLNQKLPDYMVPALLVELDAMPLTPSRKIDRRALPAPDLSRSNLDEAFVAPRTPTEETIASIFASVLQIEQVGIHDNFFELGGHSLLATQVNSRMRKTFQLDFSLRDLFEEPTVAQLAEQVETLRWASQKAVETDEDREEGEL